MNVNKIIISALDDLGIDVEPNTYTGAKRTYIIFNYTYENGENFADDEPQDEITAVQIHLFTPGNYMKLKKQIRYRLFKAGFYYPQITEFYEKDTKLNHIIFSCEIDGEPEMEE